VEAQLQTGTFESTLDDKGRVVIPASLRDHYSGELVLTQGEENCVWIMTAKAYEVFQKKLSDLPESLNYDEFSAFQYLYKAPVKKVEIDPKTGRIQIPSALRFYASLTTDCLVLSINGHLEVWNSDAYRAFMNETRLKVKEAMKKLGRVNFFPEGGQQ
jgi:MraZ protein